METGTPHLLAGIHDALALRTHLSEDSWMMEPKIPVRSRERVHIRTRESGVTLSAWRAEVESPRGAIVLVETANRSFYRGEGALLGWTQEKLAELWRSGLPEPEPEPDMPQLG